VWENPEKMNLKAFNEGKFHKVIRVSPVKVDLKKVILHPNFANVECLVISEWDEMFDNKAPYDVLIDLADHLQNLKGLFVGDVEDQVCMISSITHGDITKILEALPNLTHFKVKGCELTMSPVILDNLIAFEVESGGLSKEFLNGLLNSKFKNLKVLNIWLGNDSYGATWNVSQLKPLLKGNNVPNLMYLGLCNSSFVDRYIPKVIKSEIIKKISILNLSMGALSDKNAGWLAKVKNFTNIKKLYIDHHYLSDAMLEYLVKELKSIEFSYEEQLHELDSDDMFTEVGE